MQHRTAFDFLTGETIAVNKPYGWTSFDVVNKVRTHIKKQLGIPKVKIGHAGTLDPLASGLLILCTGKHTKLIESIQSLEKEYTGKIIFGATTPSFDLETPVDKHFPYQHILQNDLEETLNGFRGEIDQVPPVYSAIKVEGRRAFDYARNDEELKLSSRKVLVSSFDILSWEPPELRFRIVCSKGTYIRALARDFGAAMNSGAYLGELYRSRIGHYLAADAYALDDLLSTITQMSGK